MYFGQGLDECRHTVEGSVLKVVTNSVVVKVPEVGRRRGFVLLNTHELGTDFFSTRLRRVSNSLLNQYLNSRSSR